jgi:hypothetical protein
MGVWVTWVLQHVPRRPLPCCQGVACSLLKRKLEEGELCFGVECRDSQGHMRTSRWYCMNCVAECWASDPEALQQALAVVADLKETPVRLDGPTVGAGVVELFGELVISGPDKQGDRLNVCCSLTHPEKSTLSRTACSTAPSQARVAEGSAECSSVLSVHPQVPIPASKIVILICALQVSAR